MSNSQDWFPNEGDRQWFQERQMTDDHPQTLTSIIQSQAATIAELQAVIKQFSQESAMSRFDQPSATRDEDSALAPEPDDDRDTAESDANDVLSALASFQSQMEQCQDFERLMRLWALSRTILGAAQAVNLGAAMQADRIMENRR